MLSTSSFHVRCDTLDGRDVSTDSASVRRCLCTCTVGRLSTPALLSATSGAEPPVRPSPPGCHNRDRRIASSQRLASKHEARRGQLHRRGSAAGRRVCGDPLTIGFIRGTHWAG